MQVDKTCHISSPFLGNHRELPYVACLVIVCFPLRVHCSQVSFRGLFTFVANQQCVRGISLLLLAATWHLQFGLRLWALRSPPVQEGGCFFHRPTWFYLAFWFLDLYLFYQMMVLAMAPLSESTMMFTPLIDTLFKGRLSEGPLMLNVSRVHMESSSLLSDEVSDLCLPPYANPLWL